MFEIGTSMQSILSLSVQLHLPVTLSLSHFLHFHVSNLLYPLNPSPIQNKHPEIYNGTMHTQTSQKVSMPHAHTN